MNHALTERHIKTHLSSAYTLHSKHHSTPLCVQMNLAWTHTYNHTQIRHAKKFPCRKNAPIILYLYNFRACHTTFLHYVLLYYLRSKCVVLARWFWVHRALCRLNTLGTTRWFQQLWQIYQPKCLLAYWLKPLFSKCPIFLSTQPHNHLYYIIFSVQNNF